MIDPADLLSVVREDLAYISQEFNDPADDGSLRRASPVLRRLLVDGELGRAWRAAGFDRQPRIQGADLSHILAGDRSKIVFASAGGAKLRGMQVFDFVQYKGIRSSETPRAWPEPRDVTLQEFMAAPCLAIEGKVISRRVAIKYVANKLGGTHHDAKRGNTDEELLFATLDRLAKDMRFVALEMPLIYFELLAAGQAVANSKDIQKLWKTS